MIDLSRVLQKAEAELQEVAVKPESIISNKRKYIARPTEQE